MSDGEKAVEASKHPDSGTSWQPPHQGDTTQDVKTWLSSREMANATGAFNPEQSKSYIDTANRIQDEYRKMNLPEQQKDATLASDSRLMQGNALEHLKRLYPNGINKDPDVNTGPMAQTMIDIVGSLEQQKWVPKAILDPIRKWAEQALIDPSKAQGLETTAKSMIFQAAQQAAPPGQTIKQGMFHEFANAAPGVKLMPDAIKYLVTNVIIPRTQYDIEKGMAMSHLDPSDPRTNIVRDRSDWEAQHPLHGYFERAGALEKGAAPAAAAQPSVNPADRLKAINDAIERKRAALPAGQ
jgi:hypothetical protein